MKSRRSKLVAKAAAVTAAVSLVVLAPIAKADYVSDTHSAATWRTTPGSCPGAPIDATTRDGKIEVANSYWEVYVRHDGSRLRVAEDAVRYEDGGANGRSGQEICNSTPTYMLTSSNAKRWYVVDPDRVDPDDPARVDPPGDTVVGFVQFQAVQGGFSYHASSYHVVDGLWDQMDEINYISDVPAQVTGSHGAVNNPFFRVEEFFSGDDLTAAAVVPVRSRVGYTYTPRAADREVVAAAVQSYLDGFKAHDGTNIPLAENARRLENLKVRGTSAEEIRQQLAAPTMTVTDIVYSNDRRTGQPRLYIEGENAFVFYGVREGSSTAPSATRFRVVNGLITEIESICAGGFPSPASVLHPYCGDSSNYTNSTSWVDQPSHIGEGPVGPRMSSGTNSDP